MTNAADDRGATSAPPSLTPERLFADPPLIDALPQTVVFSSDGSKLLFLASSRSRREWLDLWLVECAAAALSPPQEAWLTAADLEPILADAEVEESAAEQAERERRRQFAGGIAEVLPRPGAPEVLVVCGGQGVLVHLETRALRRVTRSRERHVGLQFSPSGRYLSYVRKGDLYLLELDIGRERRVTNDADVTVSSGLADFIAQEEMHRFKGHWWSPDENALAFQRTDEKTIAISERQEIHAGSVETIRQHYPYAGQANAEVRLGVFQLEDGCVDWIDYQQRTETYLARVDWLPSGLWVQLQDRLQQTLTLGRFAAPDWRFEPTRVETSETWINLHNNLRQLPAADESQGETTLLWTTEQFGGSQLACLALGTGTASQPGKLSLCSPEALYVEGIAGIARDHVLVTGWLETPTERHLYRIALDQVRSAAAGESGTRPTAERLTTAPGWHELRVSPDGRRFVDRSSALDATSSLTLTELGDGSQARLFGSAVADQAYGAFLPSHCTPELGELTGRDGTRLCYRLTRPANASARTPVPVVVHVYGGPGVQRVRNEWASLMLQLFAQRGFAVFELDNRGSSGRGRAFEAPIYQALGTAELEDQLTGVEFLKTLDWINGERIGLFGHSYGGYMTLRGLTRAPGVFAAGVSVAPVTDWALYDTHYTERYLGLPNSADARYLESGVLGELGQINAPLLLIHGMADDNVLFTHCTAAIAELQEAGVLFDLMTYPGSRHALQEPHVSTHRFRTILNFFSRHLGG